MAPRTRICLRFLCSRRPAPCPTSTQRFRQTLCSGNTCLEDVGLTCAHTCCAAEFLNGRGNMCCSKGQGRSDALAPNPMKAIRQVNLMGAGGGWRSGGGWVGGGEREKKRGVPVCPGSTPPASERVHVFFVIICVSVHDVITKLRCAR